MSKKVLSRETDKNILLMVLSILAIIFSVAYIFVIITIVEDTNFYGIINSLILPIGVGLLLSAYTKHKKNLQKPLMGALLAYQFSTTLTFFSLKTEENTIFGSVSYTSSISVLLSVIGIVMLGVIVVNHFILNETSLSRSNYVLISKIALVVLLLSYVAQVIIGALGSEYSNSIVIVSMSIAYLRDFFLVAVIVHIESKIDIYKQQREQKNDTQE